jgi:hypothetical protein
VVMIYIPSLAQGTKIFIIPPGIDTTVIEIFRE